MTRAPRPAGKWLILGICCLSLFIVGLDIAGLNVALPSIERDLDASSSQLQWITDAYTLVLATLLMLSGSLGDRLGRKRVFLTGLVLFGAGSVLCAFATGPEMLIASRALQAVGGSMLNPVAMSIITNTFTDPRERAQAIGYWGVAVGASTALGPLVGGALVEAISWRAVFWMNVPVVAVAIVATIIFVPESRSAHARRFDPVGQALVMVALFPLTFGIIEGREDEWTSLTVLGCLLVALVAILGFGPAERRVSDPLVNPRYFASWPFSGAIIAAVVGFMSMGGFLFLNTLYLQQVRGYSPIVAGALVAPMALMQVICAPTSGRLVARSGPRLPMVLAGLAELVAALVLTRIETTTPVAVLIAAYMALGIGQGLLNAPISNSAIAGMPPSQAGVASAIASAGRQVGTSLGIAVFGTIAFGAMTGTDYSSFAAATHGAWWLSAAGSVALVVIALVSTGARATASAHKVQRLLDDAPSAA